jgi:UPF0271 protein
MAEQCRACANLFLDMSRAVDMNCDLGEGGSNDVELMPLISSANIACGVHAGNIDTMKRSVESALENNVAIGAHPGYDDKASFGRAEVQMPSDQVRQLVADQTASLRAICDEFHTKLAHVKPHGALYNQSARDPETARAIALGVRDVDPELKLFGLSCSCSTSEAHDVGLRALSEVFADRSYMDDGSLTPRSEPDALITAQGVVVEQVMNIVKYGRVRSRSAIMVQIKAETICLHGDGEYAVVFARAIRHALEAEGFEIRPH